MKLPTKPYYITTPIFYVNSWPHLGHLYTGLMADAQFRFQGLLRKQSGLFVTGTDEHGMKIQKAAEKNGQSPSVFTDKISSSYKDVFRKFGVRYDDFIRTSETRHRRAVEMFWNRLHDKGHIRKSYHEGWYCVPDETFVPNSMVRDSETDPGVQISEESGHPVEWCTEDNYVFEMSKLTDDVRLYLNQDVIHPKIFRGHLESMLKEEVLPDLSVSRPSSRLSWGIPVPNDPTQTIYVWLDALVNYLTAAGFPDDQSKMEKYWPPDCQVIGKDIIKFHAIYWPSFLIAADLPLPKKIFCHSHWMVEDRKMSKSLGNVIDPLAVAKVTSEEGLRYFLLREGVPRTDGNYSEKKMKNYLNSELANTLGNLLGRTTAKSVNVNQEFPAWMSESEHFCSDQAREFMAQLQELPDKVKSHYEDFNFYLGVDDIMGCLRNANLYIQEEKTWELKTTNPQRCAAVLTITLESLRVAGILLQPIVPDLSDVLLTKLGVRKDERTWDDAKDLAWLKNDHSIRYISGDKMVLFKKIK